MHRNASYDSAKRHRGSKVHLAVFISSLLSRLWPSTSFCTPSQVDHTLWAARHKDHDVWRYAAECFAYTCGTSGDPVYSQPPGKYIRCKGNGDHAWEWALCSQSPGAQGQASDGFQRQPRRCCDGQHEVWCSFLITLAEVRPNRRACDRRRSTASRC